MATVLESLKRIWKKALLLFGVGTAIAVFFQFAFSKANALFLPDLFFSVASVFLIAGLWNLIHNLGMFNSLKYGTKSLIALYRNKRMKPPEDKMAGGFIEYVNSREKRTDVPGLMLLALLFFALSMLTSLSAL